MSFTQCCPFDPQNNCTKSFLILYDKCFIRLKASIKNVHWVLYPYNAYKETPSKNCFNFLYLKYTDTNWLSVTKPDVIGKNIFCCCLFFYHKKNSTCFFWAHCVKYLNMYLSDRAELIETDPTSPPFHSCCHVKETHVHFCSVFCFAPATQR